MDPWATPTPLVDPNITATPFLDFSEYIYDVPEGLVQGYWFINQHGVFDFFCYMLIVLAVFLAAMAITRRLKEL